MREDTCYRQVQFGLEVVTEYQRLCSYADSFIFGNLNLLVCMVLQQHNKKNENKGEKKKIRGGEQQLEEDRKRREEE